MANREEKGVNHLKWRMDYHANISAIGLLFSGTYPLVNVFLLPYPSLPFHHFLIYSTFNCLILTLLHRQESRRALVLNRRAYSSVCKLTCWKLLSRTRTENDSAPAHAGSLIDVCQHKTEKKVQPTNFYPIVKWISAVSACFVIAGYAIFLCAQFMLWSTRSRVLLFNCSVLPLHGSWYGLENGTRGQGCVCAMSFNPLPFSSTMATDQLFMDPSSIRKRRWNTKRTW